MMSKKTGQVAYKLDLPSESRIHPVFHVSCLKRKLGYLSIPIPTLPLVDSQGEIQPEPEKLLDRRVRKVHNQVVVEVLVQWKGTTPDDATWEDFWPLKAKYPHLEGKVL